MKDVHGFCIWQIHNLDDFTFPDIDTESGNSISHTDVGHGSVKVGVERAMKVALSLCLLSSFGRSFRPRNGGGWAGSTATLKLATMATSDLSEDYTARFNNVARAYGGGGEVLLRLADAHVCVIGLGGVGSWVVESLARSGVGKLTLIDMDEICISNVNRQVMAQSSTIGKFKAEALRTRVLDINPSAQVTMALNFVRPDNAEELLTHKSPHAYATANATATANAGASSAASDANADANADAAFAHTYLQRFDYVVDAADGVSDKVAIIDACVRSGTPVVTSGGVGGLLDPTLITITDLAHVTGDNLLMRVRKKLRQHSGYPSASERKARRWGVKAVHTLPTGVQRSGGPKDGTGAGGGGGAGKSGTRSGSDDDESSALSEGDSDSSDADADSSLGPGSVGSLRKCDVSFGNVCFATGVAGFMMASVVVNALGAGELQQARPKRLGSFHAYLSKTEREKAKSEAEMGGEGGEGGGGKAGADIAHVVEAPAPTRADQEAVISATMQTPDHLDLFDAHCHLQLPPLHTHTADALALARTHGVQRVAVCGTCPGEDWDRVRDLHSQFPETVVPNFGLHPWWIAKLQQERQQQEGQEGGTEAGSATGADACAVAVTGAGVQSLQLGAWELELEALLLAIPCAGVGECGLDKAILKDCDYAQQESIVLTHLRLAAKHQRTLTLHCVSGAWARMLALLTSAAPKVSKRSGPRTLEPSTGSDVGSAHFPWSTILHSCNSLPLQMLPDFAALPGVYFSFAALGRVPDKTLKLIAAVPRDRLLIETDAPDQLPPHLRQKSRPNPNPNPSATGAGAGAAYAQYNEPALLHLHCVALAEKLNMDPAELALLTRTNALRAFNLA